MSVAQARRRKNGFIDDPAGGSYIDGAALDCSDVGDRFIAG